jgi:Cu-Zn family superoxide dismutase
MAVAVFNTSAVVGNTVVKQKDNGVMIFTTFTKLPPGKHGFHIHVAGDLREDGCMGTGSHWHKGKSQNHGDRPGNSVERHTGDLGNVTIGNYRYFLPNVKPSELWGRTLIVHADEDDLGKGKHDDSKTTGHSGKRIGCAIFGRISCNKTRKAKKLDP